MVYADFGNFRLASISRLAKDVAPECETLPLSEGINLEAKLEDSGQYLAIAKFILTSYETIEIIADGELFSQFIKDLDRFNLIWNTAKNILNTAKNILLYNKLMKEVD